MIERGGILIRTGTLLPTPLVPGDNRDDNRPAQGWVSVANHLDVGQITSAISTAGWKFFYMAGSIRKTAFGFHRQNMIDGALRRVLSAATLQNCNCVEIDGVAMHSFLGIPYASVTAHSRHIQEATVCPDVRIKPAREPR